MVQYNNSTYLVIFINSRLLILIESLASFQNVAVGVKFALKSIFVQVKMEQSIIGNQPAFYPVIEVAIFWIVHTLRFSKFLTFFSTMAIAACIEVSWTWGAPFSWGLVITEGMFKLATLVWMTKVQLLKHGGWWLMMTVRMRCSGNYFITCTFPHLRQMSLTNHDLEHSYIYRVL